MPYHKQLQLLEIKTAISNLAVKKGYGGEVLRPRACWDPSDPLGTPGTFGQTGAHLEL